ncbi:hypothetical protein SDC9_163044 [bioreactor metagenome]|uniref:Uncharacterized protein n=1 Tax=bioreactor metagenome TaxID=1076179 RepID=A0A645FP38_9ZZZZ
MIALCAVKRLIRPGKGRCKGFSLPHQGHARGAGGTKAVRQVWAAVPKGLTDLLPFFHGGLRRAHPGHHGNKLIPADAGENVPAPGMGAKHGAEPAEHLIAPRVALGVVAVLQIVHVKHKNRYAGLGLVQPRHGVVQPPPV